MIKLLSINHISNGFFECLKTLTVVGDIENNLNLAKEILDNLPPNIKIYVYCDEHDNVMGTTTLLIEQKFIHNGGKVGHIEDVGVRKEFQGLGIGTKLILHCLDEAGIQKCYKTILDCSDTTQIFYEKCGFQRKDVCMRYNH
jgi:glucosamine-phosphate N-acetyltransferase